MKYSLKLLAAAVALASTQSAFAAVNLDDADATTNGSSFYANELMPDAANGSTNPTNNLIQDVATGTIDMTGVLGFGASQGQDRYILLQLGNATFTAASAITARSTSVGSYTVVNGGTAGDDYVIIQATAPAGGMTATETVTIDFEQIIAGTTTSPVTVTYKLFETAGNAVAGVTGGTTGLLASKPATTLAKFSSGLAFTTVQRTNTATVAPVSGNPAYTEFAAQAASGALPATAEGVTVAAADITWDVSGALNPTTSTAAVIGDFMTADADITITGTNLSAFVGGGGRIFLNKTSNDCSNIDFDGTFPATGTSPVDINVGVNALNTATLCLTADGSTTIYAPQTLSASADSNGSAVADGTVLTAGAGSIDRDGTILKAAFAQGFTNTSTFVNLANTSDTDADYTVRCLSATGTAAAAGTPGTVPANSSVRLGMSAVGCPTGAGFNALEFTLAVPTGSVIGTVVRESVGNGANGVSNMTGNQ